MEMTEYVGAAITPAGRGHELLKKMQKRNDYHKEYRSSIKHKYNVKKLRTKKTWVHGHRRPSIVGGGSMSVTQNNLHAYSR